jgi:hypothetical protein
MIRFSESKFCIKMLVFVLSFLVILITRKAQVRSLVASPRGFKASVCPALV